MVFQKWSDFCFVTYFQIYPFIYVVKITKVPGFPTHCAGMPAFLTLCQQNPLSKHQLSIFSLFVHVINFGPTHSSLSMMLVRRPLIYFTSVKFLFNILCVDGVVCVGLAFFIPAAGFMEPTLWSAPGCLLGAFLIYQRPTILLIQSSLVRFPKTDSHLFTRKFWNHRALYCGADS